MGDSERLPLIAERMRITAKFHDLGVHREPPDDELIGRAVAELYGGEATPEQLDAVLDVVDNLGRAASWRAAQTNRPAIAR